MAHQTYDLTILDGPSKFSLVTSLADGNWKNRREVFFSASPTGTSVLSRIPPSIKMPVFINRLERESGSGESWLIRGIWNIPRHDREIRRALERSAVEIEGYYQTTTPRDGYLRINEIGFATIDDTLKILGLRVDNQSNELIVTISQPFSSLSESLIDKLLEEARRLREEKYPNKGDVDLRFRP